MAAFQREKISNTSERHYTMSQHEIQVDSKQDMVRQGVDAAGRPWTVVCDGHGKGKVIECLRGADWEELLTTEEPIASARILVDSLGEGATFRDGSTVSLVKVTDTGINCSWLGDSEIRIYKDGQEMWRSPRHGHGNEEELASGHVTKLTRSPTWAIKVVNDKTITMEQGLYFHYGYEPTTKAEEKLAMTRALGHNGLTNPTPQKAIIPINEAGAWKVVVGSDGVWDMIHDGDDAFLGSPESDAQTIAEFVQARWNQEWSYVFPAPKAGVDAEPQATKQTIGLGDDICAGVIQFAHSA